MRKSLTIMRPRISLLTEQKVDMLRLYFQMEVKVFVEVCGVLEVA